MKKRHDVYQSPLVERNASEEMVFLFSPSKKFGLWRRLWLALAESQRALGLNISTRQLSQMRRHLDDIDFTRAARYERRLRHDVMAHIHTFADAAPLARPIIHLGATSQFVGDNADLIIMREAMTLIASKLANLIDLLGTFAKRHRKVPTLGFTHYQPAQLTTVGKRATLWAHDFVLDLAEVEHQLGQLKFRGVKGTTGTQASFLNLFDGSSAKVKQLDKMVAAKMGFAKTYPVTGQTYSRKIDAMIINTLAGVAVSAHKMCNDLRLLANLKEVEEPFADDQVGSSAMAYKRNPMNCERATGLSRLVISMSQSPLQTAAAQWFERTLDDSSNRRIAIPEPFLAVDGILNIMIYVASGMVIYPRQIAARIDAELPFMATEEIMMAAAQAGGDRQDLHERIRRHAQAAAKRVKQEGRANDLIQRLANDNAFAKVKLQNLTNPSRFIGLAPQQVDDFITQIVTPIRRRYRKALGKRVELNV